ncbi:MAG: hypothetical protein EOR54_14510 [Mesorhizobium sp.]|nr:MAG: hypothetical protein EOR54_14510 [Mesorhizobium sp.]
MCAFVASPLSPCSATRNHVEECEKLKRVFAKILRHRDPSASPRRPARDLGSLFHSVHALHPEGVLDWQNSLWTFWTPPSATMRRKAPFEIAHRWGRSRRSFLDQVAPKKGRRCRRPFRNSED